MNLKQFEIYEINLNPTKGSEQAGIRPCIILQTNAVSDLGNTTLIGILTSKKLNHISPYEVLINKNSNNGLSYNSKLKLDQIRVIDKTRVGKKIGEIKDIIIINNIISAIDVIFDRKGYFK